MTLALFFWWINAIDFIQINYLNGHQHLKNLRIYPLNSLDKSKNFTLECRRNLETMREKTKRKTKALSYKMTLSKNLKGRKITSIKDEVSLTKRWVYLPTRIHKNLRDKLLKIFSKRLWARIRTRVKKNPHSTVSLIFSAIDRMNTY